eukprot:6192046-Pleurochrysis_carterae.AAC.1
MLSALNHELVGAKLRAAEFEQTIGQLRDRISQLEADPGRPVSEADEKNGAKDGAKAGGKEAAASGGKESKGWASGLAAEVRARRDRAALEQLRQSKAAVERQVEELRAAVAVLTQARMQQQKRLQEQLKRKGGLRE